MASPCTLMGVEYLLGSLMVSNMLIVFRSFHARDGFDDWDIFVNLEYSLSGVYCMLSWTAGIRMLNQGILWNSCSNCLSTTKDLWQHWSLHIPGYQLQPMYQLYWVLGHFLSWIVSTNWGTKSWLKWLCCSWKEMLFLLSCVPLWVFLLEYIWISVFGPVETVIWPMPGTLKRCRLAEKIQ